MPELVLVSTGNEIVSGNSIDTNSSWISAKLFPLGLKSTLLLSLPDDPEILGEQIRSLLSGKKETIIIMTGGLGPTADDFTLEAVKNLFSGQTVQVKSSIVKLQKRLESGAISDDVFRMASRQTFIPAEAKEIVNDAGLAPGFMIEKNNKVLFCLPGVPDEMKSMMESAVIPYIKKRFGATGWFYDYRFLWQMNEADFQLGFIADNQSLIEQGIEWGVAPKSGYLRVSFQSGASQLVKEIISRLEKYYSDKQTRDVFTELPQMLISSSQTVATAESCTGGLIAKMLTDTPGSSSYMKGSVVAYANEIKTGILGVKQSTLDACGAVSRETATEMCTGLKKITNADVTLSVTGIAGPGGGSDLKKVGLVYIGVSASDSEPEVYSFQFGGNRDKIREMAVNLAYYLLYLKFR